MNTGLNEELKELVTKKLSSIPVHVGKVITIKRFEVKYSGIYFVYSVDNSIQNYGRLYSWVDLSKLTGYLL